MLVLVNVTLLFIAVLAVLIYLDAERLRRQVEKGQGPSNQSPVAWAILTFLLAVIVVPLYLISREAYQGIAPKDRSFVAQAARAFLFVQAALAILAFLAVGVGMPVACYQKHRADEAKAEEAQRARAARVEREQSEKAAAAEKAERERIERARVQEAARVAAAEEAAAALERQQEAEEVARVALARRVRICKANAAWLGEHGPEIRTVTRERSRLRCDQLRAGAKGLRSIAPGGEIRSYVFAVADAIDGSAAACEQRSQLAKAAAGRELGEAVLALSNLAEACGRRF